jgi:hypothetical protein
MVKTERHKIEINAKTEKNKSYEDNGKDNKKRTEKNR